MTRVPRPPLGLPASKAEKALLLLNLLGLEEVDLDLLLRLSLDDAPRLKDAPSATQAAPSERAPAGQDPFNLLYEVVAAYPDHTVQALLNTPALRLPVGLCRSELPGTTVTARLVLRIREALLSLANRCEAAGLSLAQALDRLALSAAPQLQTTLALDDTREPEFRPLLAYHQRRCAARPVLSVRAAQDLLGRARAR